MLFNDHSKLEGTHAQLSASNPHWVNYDEDKMTRVWFTSQEARRGSRLHNLAKHLILEGVKLPKTTATLNRYVNDCIGHKMTPEQMVYANEDAYGTTDAIKFEKNKLWIFDLKNGWHEANWLQLYIYAAFFCIEYDILPHEIEIELRIYQNNDVKIDVPNPHHIMVIMDTAKRHNKLLNTLRKEAYL